MSRSTLSSACTRWSPIPKCLESPRIRTATESESKPESGSVCTAYCDADIDIYLVKSRTGTKRRVNFERSSASENDGRLEPDHPLYRDQAGQHADQDDGHRRGGQQL